VALISDSFVVVAGLKAAVVVVEGDNVVKMDAVVVFVGVVVVAVFVVLAGVVLVVVAT